jgi:hypothetical protein
MPVEQDGGAPGGPFMRGGLNVGRQVHGRHIVIGGGRFNTVPEHHGPWRVAARSTSGGLTMKGMLLWLIGIPIPIIILLYLLF